MTRKHWLLETISGLLALLFIYTAVSKLADMHLFEREIRDQRFRQWLEPWLFHGLPTLELVVAGLVMIPQTRAIGLWLYFLLMSAFSVYVGLVAFHFYPHMPCSCAGVFRKMSWPVHFVFNIIFTLLPLAALELMRDLKRRRQTRAAQP